MRKKRKLPKHNPIAKDLFSSRKYEEKVIKMKTTYNRKKEKKFGFV